jgi:hypothetical protein
MCRRPSVHACCRASAVNTTTWRLTICLDNMAAAFGGWLHVKRLAMETRTDATTKPKRWRHASNV